MPFVEVHWFEGRSDEQKAKIAKRIEAALVEVAGVAPEHCWVKFCDSAKTDFIIGKADPESEPGRGAAQLFSTSGRSLTPGGTAREGQDASPLREAL